jgi:hypothetical protein
VKGLRSYFDAMGANTFFHGEKPGNSQVILGINMNAVAEGLKPSNSHDLPEEALFSLLKVSTGDSGVVRNWADVSGWTTDTTLAVAQGFDGRL